MPYMQRLTWDGIALHAGILPGRPSSHGCIRLPASFAASLFEVTSRDSTVVVTDALQPSSLLAPLPLLAGVERAVEQGRADAALAERVDLVFHQRDERADDQGDPGGHHGRQLVAEALAAAGGHDAKDVAPPQHLLDHLPLTGPEAHESESPAERLLKTDRVVDETHGAGTPPLGPDGGDEPLLYR